MSRVSCWLVDAGDVVAPSDRLVEIVLDGVTFDVVAEQAGILVRLERHPGSIVRTGDVLGWIETDVPAEPKRGQP